MKVNTTAKIHILNGYKIQNMNSMQLALRFRHPYCSICTDWLTINMLQHKIPVFVPAWGIS